MQKEPLKTRWNLAALQPRPSMTWQVTSDQKPFYIWTLRSNQWKKTGQRHVRKKGLKIPKPPKKLKDINVPDLVKKFKDGESFLKFDSGENDKDRFLILSREQDYEHLRNSEDIKSDGTFDVPTPFQQVYVIHGSVRGKSVPMLYILLPNKKKKTYKKAFKEVKNLLGPTFKPKIWLVDFEQAPICIIIMIFGSDETLKVYVCHFHFTQAHNRWIRKHGLHCRYVSDEVFALQVKKFSLLLIILFLNFVVLPNTWKIHM